MIVISRDGAWLARLESIAERGGWPFEARAALPSASRTPPPERALAVLDRALAGASPSKAISALRAIYPTTAMVLACDQGELKEAAALVACGADEIVDKSWPVERLSAKFLPLHDRALASRNRYSADGALKAERRAHRAMIRVRGKWKEAPLDAAGFALLWRLLEREGDAVTRDELGAAIASATGRERDPGTVARRMTALKKSLAAWRGSIAVKRGAYVLTSGKK
jgi:DNA-binding response OmpR family regulator